MRTVFGVLGILALGVVLPACGTKKQQGQGSVDLPFVPPLDPKSVSVDAQNNDAAYYSLALREYTSGGTPARVDVISPLMAASGGTPAQGQGHWDFDADSAVITHDVALFDFATGLLLDAKPFVKGAASMTLFVTVSSGVLDVQVGP